MSAVLMLVSIDSIRCRVDLSRIPGAVHLDCRGHVCTISMQGCAAVVSLVA